jgi:glycosyltransferase involved in cell wall biosynthesis
MQKTDFSIELLIGEDRSTDKTGEICAKYQRDFPKVIKLLSREKNLGPSQNFIEAYKRRQGKYVALCEGDDYWVDPLKLQRQVDFLEANSDYAVSFHQVFELETGKNPTLSNLNKTNIEETLTIEDLASGNFIHTPSVVFRNGFVDKFPTWYVESPVGDYPLHLLNARHGLIKYFPEPMAVYRRHSGGVWGNKPRSYQLKGWRWVLKQLTKESFTPEVKRRLKIQKADTELRLFEVQAVEGNTINRYRYIFHAFRTHPGTCLQYLYRRLKARLT